MGLSFRICPHGCPCNGCTDASMSLLIHSHPCLCQGKGCPLSMPLYVKPPTPLCPLWNTTCNSVDKCSEEELIFFFIFPYFHHFCRAERNKSDSSVHWWSQQPRGGSAWGAVLPSKVTLSNSADWSRRHECVLTLCKSLNSSWGSGSSQKELMADLGVGPKHDPMIVDDPLSCSTCLYILGKQLLIFIPLYLQKINWSGRVRM